MQCKLFEGNGVEDEANKWMKENPNITIIKVVLGGYSVKLADNIGGYMPNSMMAIFYK